MTGNTKAARGFTLIEVLVSTAVITIVMGVVLQLVVLYFRSLETSRAELYTQAVARRIMMSIGEDVYAGFVEYNQYPGGHPTNMQEMLPLRSIDGLQTVYWFWMNSSSQWDLYVCPDHPADSPCPVGGSTDPSTDANWYKVNPDNLVFNHGEFRVLPDDSPYMTSGTPLSDESPIVQMILEVNPSDGDSSPLYQTAFTPRLYVR